MDRKTLLEKGFTEEQVTMLLNDFHEEKNALETQNAKLSKDLEDKSKEVQELIGYKTKVQEIEKSKMTEEDRIAAMRKEAEDILANAKIINNKAQATSILASVGITDENIINDVTSSDNAKTIEAANRLALTFKAMQEETVKKTKEQLSKADITPPGSNNPNNEVMTWEKFEGLSDEDKNKFAEEHPEEFNNL